MHLYLLVILYWFMPLHTMNPQIPPASYQPPYIMLHYQQPLYYPLYYAPLQYPATEQNYAINNNEYLTSESSPSQNSSSNFSSDITSSDNHNDNHGENVVKIIDETIAVITTVQEKYARRSQYRAPQALPPENLESITLNSKTFRSYSAQYRSTLVGAYLRTKYPDCPTCHKKQFHYYNQVVHAIKMHRQCIECPNLPRYRTTGSMVQHLKKHHSDRYNLIEVLEQRTKQIEG